MNIAKNKNDLEDMTEEISECTAKTRMWKI